MTRKESNRLDAIPTLFATGHERMALFAELDELLATASQSVAAGRVVPTIDIESFRAELARRDFSQPEALNNTLDWVVAAMTEGQVHMTHERYFGLFNPSPSLAAECADRIVAAFNPQICVWSHAPVAVDIEEHVIARVAARAGLPGRSGGHFTSGGSEANNTAVLCALTRNNPNFAEQGAASFVGAPRLYVSNESHLAWLKIAHQSGIGRQAVRLVPTDGWGRMDAQALATVMQKDRDAGDVAVFVAATAGTTNAGMIDPLHECADLAQQYQAWYHVDAAWGGAIIASDQYKSIVRGIERADSITIDAHKWFATTMGAGMFLTPHKSVLSETFRVTASYMPSHNAQTDLYLNSMQWSRRFIGLRLFLSLASAGWEGYAQHVERCIELVAEFNKKMTTHGWSVVNDSQMAVSCVVPPADSSRETVEQCVERVVTEGNSWVSVAQYEGQSVIRMCVTHGRTTHEDIERLVSQLLDDRTVW